MKKTDTLTSIAAVVVVVLVSALVNGQVVSGGAFVDDLLDRPGLVWLSKQIMLDPSSDLFPSLSSETREILAVGSSLKSLTLTNKHRHRLLSFKESTRFLTCLAQTL